APDPARAAVLVGFVFRPSPPKRGRGEEEAGATMAQIFHRSFNTISKVSIFGAVFILAGAGWAYARYIRSSYATGVGLAREQPVPFSHRHHVSGLGIDCRYCHTSAEDSKFA